MTRSIGDRFSELVFCKSQIGPGRKRDSDMLIAVSLVHLYFVKISMSESAAMLPQV